MLPMKEEGAWTVGEKPGTLEVVPNVLYHFSPSSVIMSTQDGTIPCTVTSC
jgi:hypothetical protein